LILRMAAATVRVIDRVSLVTGALCAVLLVVMVLVQFVVVLLRYVFGLGFLHLQELVVYLHATIFLVAAGYTLLRDEHVRIDILYRNRSPIAQAWINIGGIVLLLWPMCVFVAVASWRYVLRSWAILEGSPEGSGLPFLFVLKSMILVFAALVALQGLANLLKQVPIVAGSRSG
jgi:TRAP-type mannitol/chloroaromatic compound transport system permease small subunit